jgi:hypothetical protein
MGYSKYLVSLLGGGVESYIKTGLQYKNRRLWTTAFQCTELIDSIILLLI